LTMKKYIKKHKDGTVWAKGQLESDKMEGYWEWFRKDGSKMRTGYFKSGKRVGEWKTYNKKGNLVRTTNFGQAD
jgi:antitoxin component YwqK of YwqJK toxin-antitoxin module